MECIYAITVLINTLRAVVKNSPEVGAILLQITDEARRAKNVLKDLEYENDTLRKEMKVLQGPVPTEGAFRFYPGDNPQKIQAIKGIRGLYRLGLKEAKELVESGRCPMPTNGMDIAAKAILTVNGYNVSINRY